MKKIFLISIFSFLILGVGLRFVLTSSPNSKLALDEIKACFRQTIPLEFHPDLNKTSKVIISSVLFEPHYNSTEDGIAVYTQKRHVEQITDYLKTLTFVEAKEDEIPNKSPDGYIQFIGNKNNLIQSFTIYGDLFIKNGNNNKLYRIKNTKLGIIGGLENLDFDQSSLDS